MGGAPRGLGDLASLWKEALAASPLCRGTWKELRLGEGWCLSGLLNPGSPWRGPILLACLSSWQEGRGRKSWVLWGFGSDFTSKAPRCFQVRRGVGKGLRHEARKQSAAAFRELGPLVPGSPNSHLPP